MSKNKHANLNTLVPQREGNKLNIRWIGSNKGSMKRSTWMLLALIAALILCSNVSAQGEGIPQPSDDAVNAIAKQLYCPVCENIPLDVCSTQACAEWRDLIRLKLSEGWSEEQIKTYFADQYGERVLAAPRARGFNTWFYVLGVIFVVGVMLLVGAFILYRSFRSESRAVVETTGSPQGKNPTGGTATESTSPPASAPKPTDEYMARMEEELKNR